MNRPDIKNYFPEDTGYMDVVKSALENPWYKYATQLDMFIDELLEKIEPSSHITGSGSPIDQVRTWLDHKKKSGRLHEWDCVHHQECLDKVNEIIKANTQ